MIRFLIFAIAFVLFCTAMYLPSRYQAESFLTTVQSESDQHRTQWGDDAADRVWRRMAVVYEEIMPALPAARTESDGRGTARDGVAAATSRALGSDYFRSAQSLGALVIYRACALFELLPLVLLVLVVAVVDGFVVRAVKAREFTSHSAELFTASVAGAIVIAGLILLSLVLPFAIPPTLIAAALVVMLFVLSRAVANYHLIP